ncbi:MAG: methyl-accepting chemotaxis protein [Epsilonproteobacteria bacterium]|nr:methyl-accepting chemotaxis protein [Campylobacterota bacterium]
MIKPSGINNKLRLVGGSLTLVVVATIMISLYMNIKTKKDALIINIAGKQRMLTQMISKEIFYDILKYSTDFRIVDDAMMTFEGNLFDLINGNSARGIYPPQDKKITEKLNQVKKLWIPFKASVQELEANLEKISPKLDVFTIKINKILDLSDNVVKTMVKNNMAGKYIDLSGRQRMLSQRMGLFLKRYLRTSNGEDYIIYRNAKNLYSKTIESFLNDKKIKNNKEVYKACEVTYEYWKVFEKYSSDLITEQTNINKLMKYVYKNNVIVLKNMDEAVWLFTDYSEQKNMLFIYMQFALLSLGLIIILYSFLLTKEISNHVRDFIEKAKMLASADITNIRAENFKLRETNEDELKEASGHINSFVQKVNSALSHSQDAIDKAEKAVEELESLSEDASEAFVSLNLDENEKKGFDKKISTTEDIAIESTENLLHVTKMLEKLKSNLSNISNISQTQEKK